MGERSCFFGTACIVKGGSNSRTACNAWKLFSVQQAQFDVSVYLACPVKRVTNFERETLGNQLEICSLNCEKE